jgi:hypothetical protein
MMTARRPRGSHQRVAAGIEKLHKKIYEYDRNIAKNPLESRHVKQRDRKYIVEI